MGHHLVTPDLDHDCSLPELYSPTPQTHFDYSYRVLYHTDWILSLPYLLGLSFGPGIRDKVKTSYSWHQWAQISFLCCPPSSLPSLG